ncbi:tRNA (guanosine(37)-N1)-methyltransferase TrmD [Candidatus Mcinerneyibacteriota bacterium]|nr:tRNA (guanosine(37)-N1)-methyltransferase TrmD [Candidatus Mcinerneyibacteriota bacterium]
MIVDILTLFPEMFTSPFEESILKRAREKGYLSLDVHNIRDYAQDRHQVTDDYPYGGGAGMVMKAEPLVSAIESLNKGHHRILLTPRGKPLTQETVRRLSGLKKLMLVCGRYEGVDERVTELAIDEEISLGDFVLSGGELAAMALVDAVVRLIPGVLGNEDSAAEESFSEGLLEYPQYTRPAEFRGRAVPEVLLSGDHARIAAWRKEEALKKTLRVRPDLVCRRPVYCGLVHFPVKDKTGEVVSTSVTPIDIHDIARTCRTYGIRKYFVISPHPAQNEAIRKMLDFWEEGAGKKYNANRAEALSLARLAESIDEAAERVTREEGESPEIWATSARFEGETLGYAEARSMLQSEKGKPLMILFGTGWGLSDDVTNRADFRLAPVKGAGEGFNHLSVRSAAAVMLDRLFGNGRSL